jgi:CMP-N-acetylneuraminic acid synthetase
MARKGSVLHARAKGITSKMKLLALVTAKANSKRVPYKNKMDIGGKPLYKWTTDYLESISNEFSMMAFSSDKPESFVIDHSKWRIIHRPSILCEDCTPHVLSVQHALNEAEKHVDYPFDYAILFQPTNPLREKEDFYNMLSMLDASKPMIGKTYYIDDNLNISYIEGVSGWKEGYLDASGDGVLVRSGNMYAYSRQYLMGHNSNANFEIDSVYVCIPKFRGYNINNAQDFAIVETFMRLYKYKCKLKK